MGKNYKKTFGSGRGDNITGIAPDHKSFGGRSRKTDFSESRQKLSLEKIQKSAEYREKLIKEYLKEWGEPKNAAQAHMFIERFTYELMDSFPAKELNLPRGQTKFKELLIMMSPLIITMCGIAYLYTDPDKKQSGTSEKSVDNNILAEKIWEISSGVLTTAGIALAGAVGGLPGAAAFGAVTMLPEVKGESVSVQETPTPAKSKLQKHRENIAKQKTISDQKKSASEKKQPVKSESQSEEDTRFEVVSYPVGAAITNMKPLLFPDGSIINGWTVYDIDTATAYGQKSDSNGKPIDPEFEMASFISPEDFNNHLISTTTADGNFILLWRELTYDARDHVYCQKFNSSGKSIGDITIVGNSFNSPAITTLSNNEFAIGYIEDNDTGKDLVALQKYNSSVEKVGPSFYANLDYDNARLDTVSLVPRSSGGFATTWGSAGIFSSNGIVALKAYNEDDVVGQSVVIADSGSYPSLSVLNDQTIVATYITGDSLYFKRYNVTDNGIEDITFSSGKKSHDQESKLLSASTTGEGVLITSNSNMVNPLSAPISNGGFVVAWLDYQSYKINGQIFDPNGKKVGGIFSVANVDNPSYMWIQKDYSLSPIGNGSVTNYVQYFPGSDIYAQRCDELGKKVYYNGTEVATPSPSPTPEPTPSPTATPTPSPTDTPTPSVKSDSEKPGVGAIVGISVGAVALCIAAAVLYRHYKNKKAGDGSIQMEAVATEAEELGKGIYHELPKEEKENLANLVQDNLQKLSDDPETTTESLKEKIEELTADMQPDNILLETINPLLSDTPAPRPKSPKHSTLKPQTEQQLEDR